MNINIFTWYSERQLNFPPLHFIKCRTPITDKAKFWVYEKLSGRFYIETENPRDLFLLEEVIYFEDPQEAVMYELTWS